MTSEEFLNVVVRPNVAALEAAPNELKEAVNAFMSIDAFFGLFAVERGLRDDDLCNDLAIHHYGWRVVRDMAHSLKHGELTHGNKAPRMVKKPEAVHQDVDRLRDEGVWQDERSWGNEDFPDAVYIELGEDGKNRIKALDAVRSALTLIEHERNGGQRLAVTLEDILDPKRMFG